jgi:dimethylhistidine N-methyltransferase
MLKEILNGLKSEKKTISPKFLYDKHGSELFEQICELKEYYPTRTEIGILESYSNEISKLIGPRAHLIEFGSGSSKKTRLLINSLSQPSTYIPIDISREFLYSTFLDLKKEYPYLRILPIYADFTQPLCFPSDALTLEFEGKSVIFFPGSTLGNFEPQSALRLLSQSAQWLGRQGMMLVGIDLVKNREILEKAYNDPRGITAAFNLNLLRRINQELQGNFDLNQFRHHAYFNIQESRIEMHLMSQSQQDVSIQGEKLHFEKGESIHTENSYKYTPDSFERMAHASGFNKVQMWTDPQRLFAVYLLEAIF